jgi:hypothetical protein
MEFTLYMGETDCGLPGFSFGYVLPQKCYVTGSCASFSVVCSSTLSPTSKNLSYNKVLHVICWGSFM